MNHVELYLARCRSERNLAESTIEAYRAALDSLSSMLSKPVEKATTKDIERFSGSMSRLSPSTQRHRMIAVRGFYRFLRRDGIVDRDPTVTIELPKDPRRLPKARSMEDVKALIAAATLPRDRALLALLFWSGLRVSEAIAVEVEDLDLDRAVVLVRHGKGDRQRRVPIGDNDALRAHALAVGSGPLFRGCAGRETLTRQAVNSLLARLAVKAGVRAMSPHALRHSIATIGLERGMTILEVAQLLGHASADTATIYSGLAIEHLARIIDEKHPRG